jgi:hypothetical protein
MAIGMKAAWLCLISGQVRHYDVHTGLGGAELNQLTGWSFYSSCKTNSGWPVSVKRSAVLVQCSLAPAYKHVPMTQHTSLLLDINIHCACCCVCVFAGSWSLNPSGCTLPQAADMPGNYSLAAVAADEHTIMLLRSPPRVPADASLQQPGAPHPETVQPPGRVDLLDLRMWRWRQGAPLARDCLHG